MYRLIVKRQLREGIKRGIKAISLKKPDKAHIGGCQG
jgi:hypothetical protein